MEYEEFVEAIRKEEEVKTKHLQKKAEKKKVTRKVKHDKIVMRDHVRSEMKRHIEYQIKSLRQRNAKDCDVVAFINKKYAQIRQIMSE
jgi:vacuolar-type H+-ATPase catalytic subunit A/Vma1